MQKDWNSPKLLYHGFACHDEYNILILHAFDGYKIIIIECQVHQSDNLTCILIERMISVSDYN